MIKLGERIILEGFEEVEPAHLILVKKVVGVFAKKFCEQENLEVRLGREGEEFIVCAKAGSEKTGEGRSTNLFVAIGSALKKVE